MRDGTRIGIGALIWIAAVGGLAIWSRSGSSRDDRGPTPLEPASASAPPQPAEGPRPPPLLKPAIHAPPVPVSRAPKPPPLAAPAPAHPETPPGSSPPAARTPFPSGLPPAFTAEGFHAGMQRVIAACRFPYSIEEEDCTEYPCIAWGSWDAKSVSPGDCPEFEKTYGDRTFVFARPGKDGKLKLGLGIVSPDGDPATRPAFSAIQQRANGMFDSLGAGEEKRAGLR